MFIWLQQNLATIIVALIILAIVAAIIIVRIRDKKAGKSSCSCGCSGCAMKDSCHTKNNDLH